MPVQESVPFLELTGIVPNPAVKVLKSASFGAPARLEVPCEKVLLWRRNPQHSQPTLILRFRSLVPAVPKIGDNFNV